MATTINTRYVDPDAAAGGDGTTAALEGATCAYQSLFAWEAVATAILTIAMADGARMSGELAFTIEATDASADNDVYVGSVRFAAQRKGATVTCSIGAIGTPLVTKSHAGADMAVVATADVASGTSVVLKLNADSALTPTTLKAHWHLRMLKDHGVIS